MILVSYTPSKLYTIKERIFLATAYIPKSTTVATVAGIIYSDALAMGPAYHDYQVMGLQIQTTCVVAIIVLSFIGTFMIDFLGPRFLQTDVAPAATTTSADLE